MNHWAPVSPVSLGNGFIFFPLDCLARFLVHRFPGTESKPHCSSILAYKEQC